MEFGIWEVGAGVKYLKCFYYLKPTQKGERERERELKSLDNSERVGQKIYKVFLQTSAELKRMSCVCKLFKLHVSQGFP